VFRTALALLADLLRLLRLMVRSRTHLAAENLFIRKQLACYIERVLSGNSIHTASLRRAMIGVEKPAQPLSASHRASATR
jgi:hypothetical protein